MSVEAPPDAAGPTPTRARGPRPPARAKAAKAAPTPRPKSRPGVVPVPEARRPAGPSETDRAEAPEAAPAPETPARPGPRSPESNGADGPGARGHDAGAVDVIKLPHWYEAPDEDQTQAVPAVEAPSRNGGKRPKTAHMLASKAVEDSPPPDAGRGLRPPVLMPSETAGRPSETPPETVSWFEPPDHSGADLSPTGPIAMVRGGLTFESPAAHGPVFGFPPTVDTAFAPALVPPSSELPVPLLPLDAPAVAAGSKKRRDPRPLRRPRARRVERVVRRVDPWSVLKVSAVFYVVVYLVLLVAGVLLWALAISTGTIDNVENFIKELFALDSFSFRGDQILSRLAGHRGDPRRRGDVPQRCPGCAVQPHQRSRRRCAPDGDRGGDDRSRICSEEPSGAPSGPQRG